MIVNHQPTIALSIERCWECGSFWALEQGKNGKCPHCARRAIDAAYEESKQLEKRLNAQKAATSRAAKGRR